jgi:uncharacterized protein involved in exopolysaccharide biosynthesis
MNAADTRGTTLSQGLPTPFDFRLLWRRKGTFVLCTLLTTALGGVYLALEQPTYEVTRRLLVEQEKLATEDGVAQAPNRQFVPTQAELVRSPKVIRRALEKSGFQVPEKWSHDAVGYIQEELTVVPVVDTSVLKIRFRDKNKEAAAGFVESLVGCYREVLSERQNETVDGLKTLLVQEEERRRDELSEVKQRHVELLAKSPYPANLAESARVKSEELMQLTRQLADVRLRRTTLATRLKQVRDVTATEVARAEGDSRSNDSTAVVQTVAYEEPAKIGRSAASALAGSRLGKGMSSEQNMVFDLLRDEQGRVDNVLSEVQRQLTQAQVRKQQLSVQYGPKHDAMRQVEAEISRLEHMLNEQMASLMDSLQQRLIGEEASELELARRCEDQSREVKALDGFVAQDETIRAEMKRTQDAYELVFAQLKQVSLVDEALTTGRGAVSVSDLETSNEVPPVVWPLPLPLLAISFAVGVFAALMWIYSGEVIRASTSARVGQANDSMSSLPAMS